MVLKGELEKKGDSGLFNVSSLIPVGSGCYVVKADPLRRRLPEGSTALTSKRMSG